MTEHLDEVPPVRCPNGCGLPYDVKFGHLEPSTYGTYSGYRVSEDEERCVAQLRSGGGG